MFEEWKNRKIILGNCSGVYSSSFNSLKEWIEAGVDFVVTKTVTFNPREGHKNPTVAIHKDYVIQAMGLPNPGYKKMIGIVRKLKSKYKPR